MTKTQTSEGFLYLVTHEVWPGWVKIGKTINPTDRLRRYQTSDPTRSFQMAHVEPAKDHHYAEYVLKQRLIQAGWERTSEWFFVPLNVALMALKDAVKETPEPTEGCE